MDSCNSYLIVNLTLLKKEGLNCPLNNRLSTELLVYKNEKPKNVIDNDEKIKSSSVNFI